jgi:hypothetical protein
MRGGHSTIDIRMRRSQELFFILELFQKMVQQGVRPNVVTFSAILNACRYIFILTLLDPNNAVWVLALCILLVIEPFSVHISKPFWHCTTSSKNVTTGAVL